MQLELSFWFYVLFIPSVLLIAFMLTFSLYIIGSVTRGYFLKRKMPKDADKLLNPGKPTQRTQKEVDEDERRQFQRFREYEKLRRFGEKSGNSRGSQATSGRLIRPVTDLPNERFELPKQSTDTTAIKHIFGNGRNEERTAEIRKSPKLTRPEFL